MRNIKRIIVHCSDTLGGDVESIRRFHTAMPPEGRGWSDIGYHAVIVQDGEIQPGRPEETKGAHCAGHNEDSLGVCLVGKNLFTGAQFASLLQLLMMWCFKYKIDHKVGVFCHYGFDTKGKTCPNFTKQTLMILLDGKFNKEKENV